LSIEFSAPAITLNPAFSGKRHQSVQVWFIKERRKMISNEWFLRQMQQLWLNATKFERNVLTNLLKRHFNDFDAEQIIKKLSEVEKE